LKASVRGVYSTALVKLLLDEGFTIVNPTRSQTERFGIALRDEPDVEVMDYPVDRHCIEVRGSAEAVESLLDVLRRRFGDLIILRRRVSELDGRAVAGFPNESKLKLDELRSLVTYTVPFHHYCRAGGEGLSSMVSFAEDLVERGLVPADEMSRIFGKQVQQMAPRIGAAVKIVHVKPDGRMLSIGPCRVVWRGEGRVRLQRRILSPGIYDGLGVEKCPGDYAITDVAQFQPWMKTSYYGISGELKGRYYNISTPIAVYPDHVHYFDLEVDVVVKPNSEAEIIDAELLDKAVEEGRIGKGLRDWALKIAEEIASKQP